MLVSMLDGPDHAVSHTDNNGKCNVVLFVLLGLHISLYCTLHNFRLTVAENPLARGQCILLYTWVRKSVLVS